MLENMKYWDYPKIGKFILLLMLLIEMSTYTYLTINNQQSHKAVLLSCYLLLTSVITFVGSALAIPLRFYFNHWVLFFMAQGLAILSRTVAIVWIVVLNN